MSEETKHVKPGEAFSAIKPKMRTLDLLLFRGSDFISSMISKVEQTRTGSGDYTHAGIVVLGTSFPPGHVLRSTDTIYVFESTQSGKLSDGVPAIDGKPKFGVQLRSLDRVVPSYDSSPNTMLAWCPLKEKFRPPNIDITWETIYNKYNGRTYNASAIDLAGAAIPLCRRIRESRLFKTMQSCYCCCCGCCCSPPKHWLFCSELVASIYKDYGILNSNVEPHNVLPVDFLPNPKAAAEQKSPSEYGTIDSEGEIPWLYDRVIRYHADV